MGCQTSKLRRRSVPVQGAKVIVEEGVLQSVETSKNSNTLTRVNQYKLEQVLGKGSFGAVYRAADAQGVYVAIKVMEKGELRKKSKGIGRPQLGPPKSKSGGGSTLVSMSIAKEIAVMKRVNHPNCVRLFEVIDDPAGDRMFLVMDLLLGGEVLSPANLPSNQAYLNEEDALEVFRDLLDGLEYLHGNGILHRDIKPVRHCPSRPLAPRALLRLPAAHGADVTSQTRTTRALD
jgi:serine/threonine protein kinase